METATEVTRLAPEDLDGAARVAVDAMPMPGELPERRFERVRRRLAAGCATDPEGVWVAREEGRIAGFAMALTSDGLWVLAQLFVDPATQGRGLGRALLTRALRSAAGARGALITASADPRAIRLYGGAGFAPRPALSAHGPVDRRALPALELVRDGDVDDVERTAAIDRAVRGGARTRHIAQLVATGDRLYLARGGRGYAVGTPQGRVATLAAVDEEAARALLWRVLADVPADGNATVHGLTATQAWAFDVALCAGLALAPGGPLFTRGRVGPLTPFLPSGAYS
ncbi:MAG: GCN5-related N-acetyltransferase [Conexibacter sp.]|nr:GCN5-related N-acetyltransferase [Conexibacter sp.]